MIHIGRTFTLFLLAGVCLKPADTPSAPVLVELFTSEGCSSCPPADRLLETLDRNPNVIVLSEHVDYWNQLGWRDPYSSAAASQRQSEYARKFRLESVYTPQMVINGRTEAVGNDSAVIARAIAKAGLSVPLELSEVVRDGNKIHLRVRSAEVPANVIVYVAFADDKARSEVARGENSGRTLNHVAVVRRLSNIGIADTQHNFDKQITLPLGWEPKSGVRVIAFLEDRGTGAILGATRYAGLL